MNTPPEVHEKVLAEASRERVSSSAWMTTAAQRAPRIQAGLAAVANWENQHGAFTPDEMDEAQRTVAAQLQTSRKSRRSK
jgi:hypothetical protein